MAVSAEGRRRKFGEKDASNGSGWINTGMYLLTRRLLQTIPVGEFVSLKREMFPAWLGREIYGSQGGERFLDIGTPESYAAAAQIFARTH
jgi:NDP-sugar pyrophosphorylase family protein